MDDYSKFEEIKVEDIGLIYCNSENKIYKNLKKNNINNLKQILELNENEYLISIKAKTKKEFIGLLNLIRFKYLKEQINIIDILNEEPVLIQSGINKGKYRFDNLYKLGFDTTESNKINQQLYRYNDKEINNIKLIYILVKYPINFKSLNGEQSKIQLNKIDLLIEYYEKNEQLIQKENIKQKVKK